MADTNLVKNKWFEFEYNNKKINRYIKNGTIKNNIIHSRISYGVMMLCLFFCIYLACMTSIEYNELGKSGSIITITLAILFGLSYLTVLFSDLDRRVNLDKVMIE
jgi:hypothetical protein